MRLSREKTGARLSGSCSSRKVTGWIASFQGRYRDARLQGGGGSPAYFHTEREDNMPESIYDVIQLIGTSNESWEKAAANAVELRRKISPRCSHRRNRRTRYATGCEGKGRSISREGQVIVQTRRGLCSALTARVCTARLRLAACFTSAIRQLLRQRRIRFNVKRSCFSARRRFSRTVFAPPVSQLVGLLACWCIESESCPCRQRCYVGR